MNKTIQQLSQYVTRHFLETNVTVEPFISELVCKFVLLSCYQDVSRTVQLPEKDFQKLAEIAVQMLDPEDSVTARTLRLLGAHVAEFVAFNDQRDLLIKRPSALARSCFQAVQPMRSPDAVYAQLEQLLADSCRPFSLEQNNTQLAYGLKISLNSILPRSDVLVFRDMLVKEASQDRPGQHGSGEKQLVELAEVTAGVCLVGDPPVSALSALEQQVMVVLKSVEIQLNQQLGVYLSTTLPMTFYQLDIAAQTQSQQQLARQLLLYQINRCALVSSLSLLFKQLLALNSDYQRVSGLFREQIQQLQQTLKSQESIPKATIYPKFAQVAQLYQQLQRQSELLIQLKSWHQRLGSFSEDREFTPLPDAGAKKPLFDSDEVVKARQWFQRAFSKEQLGVKSRLARMTVQNQAQQMEKSVLKDLTQFQALDADQLFDMDCLFGGFDPVCAFCPSFARPGLLVFSNTPALTTDLQAIAGKISVNNPTLELVDNRTARERVAASTALNLLTTVQSQRGYELIAFSSVQTKLLFEQSPGLFMIQPLVLAASSPDFLPLVILMDLPNVARALNSVQLKPLRTSLITQYVGQSFDLLPLQKTQAAGDEPPAQGVQGLVHRADNPRRAQPDIVGYLQKPKSVQLFEDYLLNRLQETEIQGAIYSNQFTVEQLLSSEVLSFFADLYGAPALQKYVEFRSKDFKTTPEALVGLESYTQRQQVVRQTADNRQLVDEEIQTPLHFYESNIVKGYTSSEWELRARALRLYEIQQKRTKAVNTDETVSKESDQTQTVEKKDSEVQNAVDGGNHAVQQFTYQRKTFPQQAYAGMARTVQERCQLELKIDLDEIRKQADALRALRTATK